MKPLVALVIIGLLGTQHAAYPQAAVYGPVAESLQNSAHQLFYNPDGPYYNANNSGNTTFNYWWNAQALDALLDGYLRTNHEVYKQRMKNVLLGIRNKNGGVYPNHYYDDMEWLALSSLRAYQHTSDRDYLDAVNILWQDIKGGSHPERGGAFQWNKGEPWSFNACGIAPAIILAVRLYRVNGNPEDLALAKSAYTWMKGALVDSVSGAVWDSYNANTRVTNKDWIFSYNVGTWIGAGLELYKITKQPAYLTDAVRTADYVLSTRLSKGVLWSNEVGTGDGGLFKGIFIRYFAQLAREGALPRATRRKYVGAIRSSAQALQTQGINPANQLVSPNWTKRPAETTDHATQLSGVMLIEAAALDFR